MDRLVYTAASGLQSHMRAQAAIANNIANASTTGFRADRVDFDRMMIQGPGFDSRTQATESVIDADRRAGTVVSTNRPLDVAMGGDAWLAVQAADGTEAYTRRGALTIAPSGVLATGDGVPVIGSGSSCRCWRRPRSRCWRWERSGRCSCRCSPGSGRRRSPIVCVTGMHLCLFALMRRVVVAMLSR